MVSNGIICDVVSWDDFLCCEEFEISSFARSWIHPFLHPLYRSFELSIPFFSSWICISRKNYLTCIPPRNYLLIKASFDIRQKNLLWKEMGCVEEACLSYILFFWTFAYKFPLAHAHQPANWLASFAWTSTAALPLKLYSTLFNGKQFFSLSLRRRFFYSLCLHFFLAAEKDFFSCFFRVRSTYWWSYLARLGHSGIEIISQKEFSVHECQILPLSLKLLRTIFDAHRSNSISFAAFGVQCTNILRGRTKWHSTRFLIKKLVSGFATIRLNTIVIHHSIAWNPNKKTVFRSSGFQLFKDYCENYRDEPVPQLKFYEEIRNYEKTECPDERKKLAKSIYDNFIMKEMLSHTHVSFLSQQRVHSLIICFDFHL